MFTKENQSLLSKYKQRNKQTSFEIKFEEFLIQNKVKYKKQKGFLSKTNRKFYIVDFYLPKPVKLVIEIDGEYHKNRQAYDTERDRYFREVRNINVLRIPNELVFDKEYLKQVLRENSVI